MCSTNNEGKPLIAERFIRTLKTKTYKYVTSISKNVYIDKLDDIIKEYNNKYHTSIKMKPADVNYNTYIDFKKETNDKNPKFKVGDHVRISQNWLEDVFMIKKIKNTVPWTCVINDLTMKRLLVLFMKRNYKARGKMNLE